MEDLKILGFEDLTEISTRGNAQKLYRAISNFRVGSGCFIASFKKLASV